MRGGSVAEEVIGCREPLGDGMYNMWLTELHILTISNMQCRSEFVGSDYEVVE